MNRNTVQSDLLDTINMLADRAERSAVMNRALAGQIWLEFLAQAQAIKIVALKLQLPIVANRCNFAIADAGRIVYDLGKSA